MILNNLSNAEKINQDIANLPKARLEDIYIQDNRKINNLKLVMVDEKPIACVSRLYKLVQHENAFRPIISGVTIMGSNDFKYSLVANHKKANLNLYVVDGDLETDSVSFGFRVMNSFDGKSSIRYGFSTFKSRKTIEIVGYRKVCSNGMLMRVPLDNAEFIREEERVKLVELLSKQLKVRHQGLDVEEKILNMAYVVEAMILLKNPIKRIINTAKEWSIEDGEKAKEIIEGYIGKRMRKRILERYGVEDNTLWGLYNAVTYVASHHDLTVSTKNSLLEKSATMLEKVLEVN